MGTLDDLTDDELETVVRSSMSTWFGSKDVAQWKHIQTYRIPFAQPSQVFTSAISTNYMLKTKTSLFFVETAVAAGYSV